MWDCTRCGACCREAFDAVPVDEGDLRTRTLRPEALVPSAFGGLELRRVPSPTGCGTRCHALTGDGEGPYLCRMYEDRPEACSGLDVGSEACVFARGRVGLPTAQGSGVA